MEPKTTKRLLSMIVGGGPKYDEVTKAKSKILDLGLFYHTGVLLTTLHFLRNLRMSAIS
jgi:hypothetical protein